MKWYGNLKIGAKLAVGFGLIVALVVALSTYSVFTAKSIDADYTYLIDFPQHRFDTMSEIKTEFVNARRSLSHMNVFSGLDDSQVTAQLTNIDTILTQINVKLQEYNSLVTNDNRFTDSERNDRTQAVTELQAFLSQWRNDLVKPVYQACLDGNRQEVITLSSKYASLSNNVINSIDDLYNKAKDIADNLNVSTTASANSSILVLVAISIIIAIISVLLAVVITSFITKPIKRLVSLVSEVSQGNININTDRENISKDETGELTLDVYALTDVIKTIISDITQLTREIMVNGDIDYRIEVNQYKGSYHEMTSGINDFASGYIEEINQFLTLLDGISNGDFNADMKKMPGKKAIINSNVDALKKNLENVSADLSTLTISAGEGKLNVKADVGKYRGDWAEILNGLNHLMEVIAAPIQEAADVLKEVSAGNFDQKMQGNYLGDFLIIKDSINNTVTNIASYIEEISDVLAELSKKNLNQSITREYVGKFSNIKVALVNIINTLNNVISEIKSAAEQVAAGAKQISESSMTLAQGATEQASSVEELNATVLTINEGTKQNAESAKQAESLSDSSKINAARGDQDMSSMLVSMDSIKESSNSISRIIKVIEDIAFQTNLLALNAAVEAARAGEHGKGFAVVAEEVRTLAGRSKSAAKETSDLIEESINRVNEGTKIAGQTAGALQTIVGDVTKVAEIITGIAESSVEQAIAIKEVTEGISQITDVVQNNSATSEEAASASQQLSSQAEMLQSMVEEFKLR